MQGTPQNRVLAQRYVLETQLGQGSMGAVWVAEDTRLRRQVAIKILAPIWASSDDARSRFEREAFAAARLKSPHIVQIFDYGIDEGTPFIVMELLEGEDLGRRLKARKSLTLAETAEIVVQVARALGVAHKAGIVHRDLKPANLMLDRSTGDEVVKVLDFGVAKAAVDAEAESTKAGSLLGTPQFMAPEQARGLADVDHRCDLWSVAVIAYRALTGRLPFEGDSVPDVIVKVCSVDPPRATVVRPDLPPLVNPFFERGLARERDRRFQSAKELAAAFFDILNMSAPSLLGLEALSHPTHPTRPSQPTYPSQPTHPSQPSAGPQASSRPPAASAGTPITLGTQASMVGELVAPKPRRRLALALVIVLVAIVGVSALGVATLRGSNASAAKPTDNAVTAAAPAQQAPPPVDTGTAAAPAPATTAAPAPTTAPSGAPVAVAGRRPFLPPPKAGEPPPPAPTPPAPPPPKAPPPKGDDPNLFNDRN
jgi:eukaryotic-like serine/threonine-protein kinase